MIFQYSSQITIVSYLSRIIEVNGISLQYRKIKNNILYDVTRINRNDSGINIASPERAFLDCFYLNKRITPGSVHNLNKDIIRKMIPLYKSEALKKVQKSSFECWILTDINSF